MVTLHVCFQAVALGEGFVTEGTLVGSLSVVGSHVDGQVFLSRTSFAANPAGEALDAQVAPDVDVQGALEFEVASAPGAAVGRLASVNAHVFPEVPFGEEASAADGADERSLVAVGLHVSHQGAVGQEGFAADVAQVHAVPDGVDLLVRLQGSLQLEALPADFAAVAALRGMSQFVTSQRP